MADRKSIGIPGSLFSRPFLQQASEMRHTLVTDSPSNLAIRLRENRIDVALISPLDYARDGSLYRIVPGLALASRDASNAVVLQFRQGVHTVSTVAVRPHSIGDVILAKIILTEEFDISPAIVPVDGPVGEMLLRADAALITGDDVFALPPERRNAIDLVEAWSEMTELPYVHGVFCYREGRLSADDLREFRLLSTVDDAVIAKVTDDAVKAQSPPGQSADDLRSYLSSFSYTLTDEAEEGLKEFLKYTYYHGIIPDVPDLHYSGEIESFGKDG